VERVREIPDMERHFRKASHCEKAISRLVAARSVPVATLVHDLLDRMPPAESQIFTCEGLLAGYRMSIDWNRFRSIVYGA
jgi:hypothetical protein